MKKYMNLKIKSAVLILMMAFAISCVPINKISYFNDIDDLGQPAVNPKIQKTIMPFDRLYIKVLSTDPQTNQIFNFGDEVRYGDSQMIGYPVNEAGDINFPFAGNINVGSLTTAQAALKIQNALNEYVLNTSVIVKFIDNKISVLGEVQRQGVLSFTQDKLNIYEAIALGGGLTRYGNRNNVVLIRQEGDKIMHHKINLSDSKIASKDYYYVLPNDVIIVEPMKSISTNYQNITYSSVLSTITTIVATLMFTWGYVLNF